MSRSETAPSVLDLDLALGQALGQALGRLAKVGRALSRMKCLWPSRATWMCLGLLAVLNLCAIVPSWALPGSVSELEGQDRGFRIVFSFLWFEADLLIVLVLLALSPRLRALAETRIVSSVLGGFFGFLFLFELYDVFIRRAYARPAVLYDDIWLVSGALHLASDLLDSQGEKLFVGLLGLVLLCGVLIPRLLRRWIRTLETIPRPRASATAALLLLTIGVFDRGLAARDGLTQSSSSRLAQNLGLSLEMKRELDALEATEENDRDLPEDELSGLRLQDPPSVFLFAIESYGAITFASEALRARHQDRVETFLRRTKERGFDAVSRLSRAPVVGGTSWLATASLLGGRRIDGQSLYQRQVREGVYAMPAFFKELGYFTLAIQPGTRVRPGLPISNPYGYEQLLNAPDLEYQGPSFGWGAVPDQVSLRRAGEVLSAHEAPYFVFFMTVSSHAPWSEIPPLLGPSERFSPRVRRSWIERLRDRAIEKWTRRSTRGLSFSDYDLAIEYEFQVLGDFIADHVPPHSVLIIVGDHQPAFLPIGDDRRTPMHVLSDEAAVLAEFENLEFVRGIKPPTDPGLETCHEALFSILAHVLARTRGSDRVPKVRPTGFSRTPLGSS